MPARSRSTSYAALLRGVNLGSHNRVAMSDLRALVEGLGATDVRTYVQSGNVVFRSGRAAGGLAAALETAIRDELDLEVAVVLRSERRLRDFVGANPFSRSKAEPKTLYATFLSAAPDPERVRRLEQQDFAPERFQIVGDDVYLSFPNGSGRVKLSNATLERQLGVAATTRNWRTVTALAELTATG